MNLIINLENDDWILDDMKRTMADCGAGMSLVKCTRKTNSGFTEIGRFICTTVNETEYSLFNREAYNTFKANPTVRIGCSAR
jgi:hypothetical protein